MSKIRSIINQQKVSTRIKFMLQDVIELRNVRTLYYTQLGGFGLP